MHGVSFTCTCTGKTKVRGPQESEGVWRKGRRWTDELQTVRLHVELASYIPRLNYVCTRPTGLTAYGWKCVDFSPRFPFSPTSTKVNVGGPDGGDGGGGGGVVFVADASVKSLCSLLSHYRARDGSNGQGSYRQGPSGRDVVIKVLCNTLGIRK